MKKMMTTLNRAELYREIWQMSVKKVAEKYNLNYSKLLAACRENSIPIPSSKYWVDLRTGKDVSDLIEPLPDYEKDEIIVESNVKTGKENSLEKVSTVPDEESKDSGVVNYNSELLNSLKNRLQFLPSDKIDSIYEVLINKEFALNKRLNKKVVNYKKSVELWHRKENNSKRDYFDSRYEPNNIERPMFIKEISAESLSRLYKLLDILVELFHALGEKVTDDFKVQIDSDYVEFEIIESKDKIKHELTKEEARELLEYEDAKQQSRYASRPKIRKYDHVFNGVFRIKTSTGKYVRDKKNLLLEEMLGEIVIIFYESYFEIKERREEREEAERLREIERKREDEHRELVNTEKKKLYSY